jgi:hypothetical protein
MPTHAGDACKGNGGMWRERCSAVLLAVLLLPHTSWAIWTQVDSLDNPVDRPDVYLRCIDVVGCVPGLDGASTAAHGPLSAALLDHVMTCAAGGIELLPSQWRCPLGC